MHMREGKFRRNVPDAISTQIISPAVTVMSP
jgi:hypothetical protein